MVQKETSVTAIVTTSVPMEYDPEGGCFVKFTFPPELLISSNHLKAFEGEGYLNTEYGKEIIPVEKDFESDVKYAIF